MNLEIFTNKNSSLEHTDARPSFLEMTMLGFTNQLYKTKLPSYKIGVSFFKEDETDYISLKEDQNIIGRTIIREYIKNKHTVLDLHKIWQKEFSKLMKFYYVFFQQNIDNFTNSQLLEKSEELYFLYSKQVSMPGFIDGFAFYTEVRLSDIVKKFCEKNNIHDYISILSTLTALTDGSFLNKEEGDLYKIINKFFLNKKIIRLEHIISNKKIHNEIKNHILKYSWIKSSYVGYKEYKLKDVVEEINRIINDNKKSNNLFIKNKNKKLRLIKKYKFNLEIIAIVELFDIFIKWQDQRKQYTLTFVTLKNKILKEISKRANVPFCLITYSLSAELESILDGKFNINILKKRKSGSLFVWQRGRSINIITGKKAIKFIKRIISKSKNNIKEITGSVASAGFVSGVVKIVTSVKYLNKLKNGDILVVPMTRPEYLVGIRRAIAIITDDGGITSHAAIVSRELGIPCIIGTKIATKVLKDGDFVEVDANNGVIKVLK